MEDLTPEQKDQLGTWAVQRDGLLLSIAKKTEEEKILTDSVNNLSQTKTEVYDEIQRSIGRLEELKKKEAEFATLTTTENAVLREEKSRLQTEVSGLHTEIDLLNENKTEIVKNTGILVGLFDRLFDKTHGLESLVGAIVKVASDNATEVRNILIVAGAELQKVIDIGERNVQKTNQLISDVPKLIVDIHRDILERKIIARNRLADIGVEPKTE